MWSSMILPHCVLKVPYTRRVPCVNLGIVRKDVQIVRRWFWDYSLTQMEFHCVLRCILVIRLKEKPWKVLLIKSSDDFVCGGLFLLRTGVYFQIRILSIFVLSKENLLS